MDVSFRVWIFVEWIRGMGGMLMRLLEVAVEVWRYGSLFLPCILILVLLYVWDGCLNC